MLGRKREQYFEKKPEHGEVNNSIKDLTDMSPKSNAHMSS